jgi:hypothetical protein
MPATEHEHTFDEAADDARQLVREAHYTGCRVCNESETLELWLFDAPVQVLQKLESIRPGVYLIHNDAPRPHSAVLELMDALRLDQVRLEADGINVVGYGPSVDGYLNVKVMGDVPTAQARLDTMYGSHVARVEYGEPARAG